MVKHLGVLILLLAVSCASASAQELNDKEKARIRAQVEALKESKLKEAEQRNKSTKNDAIQQGEAIDRKATEYTRQVDGAVENYSSRFGPNFSTAAGEVRKQQIQEKAKAEKEKIAKEARKKGVTQMGAAKKNVDDIEQSVEGLKSQVSKSGKFGLKPKGSSVYVRNYGGKE